jgi:hypothetical protein
MFTVKSKIVSFVFLLTLSSIGLQFAVAQNETNTLTNNFVDPKTGIALQYQLDWRIASQEFTDQMFSADSPNDESVDTTSPILTLFHESLDGGSFVLLSEILPFPMSVDSYVDLSRKSLAADPSVEISNNITSVSIAGLDGLKYDVYLDAGLATQTQIAFVKDSNAFVVGYTLGGKEQSRQQLDDVNKMINSISFQ